MKPHNNEEHNGVLVVDMVTKYTQVYLRRSGASNNSNREEFQGMN